MGTSPGSGFRSSAGAEMLKVPAGSFTIGSSDLEEGHWLWEQPREVTFLQDFYLGKSPVTQEQYEAVTGTNPTDHEPDRKAPVDSVSWESATEYCQKLTALDRASGVLPGGWEYRLPTEAEWEYACREGSREARHGAPQDVAWYCANAADTPHAVGQKLPNAWGFHDMLGNFWEWCQEWFSAGCRSVRGGSYFNSARFCRSAQRWGWTSFPGRYCGFRLLAAREGPFELSPPIESFPPLPRPPSIFDAIDANDFDRALEIIKADPAAIELVDLIPPPLHSCVYDDRPEWVEWLLDHGANLERREQDYGSTPLTAAVVMRRQRIIPILVSRGARTEGGSSAPETAWPATTRMPIRASTVKATGKLWNYWRGWGLTNRCCDLERQRAVINSP